MNKNIEQIVLNRKRISEALMKESQNIKTTKITKISPADLEILFKYYDKLFFNNSFASKFEGKIKFSFSKRMTKSAGVTKCPRNIATMDLKDVVIEICMGINFIFNYDEIPGSKKVCGIKTDNSLVALQIVFEHELCHAMEYINYGSSNCKAQRFKDIAFNIFGHTQSHHKLPTNREIIKEKMGINIGDKVSFVCDNKVVRGFVSNINKRATVMVENKDGDYIDKQGNRYGKYYVPVKLLKVLK